jgi:hypothetical protein
MSELMGLILETRFALRGRARGAQSAINDNLLDFAACLG